MARKQLFWMTSSRFVLGVGLTWPFIADAALVVSDAPTQNVTCSAGTCAPTSINAVLNVQDMESYLQAGNLSVTTTGSSVEAGDIMITVPLGWHTNLLSLTSYHSIYFREKVFVGANGGLTITTDNGGSSGRMVFGKKGRVAFESKTSPVSINGTSYVLVGSIANAAKVINSGNGSYSALMDNYDASADGTYAASPITNASTIFEGFGNAISNFTLVDNQKKLADVGLITDAGSVYDLRLLNVSITADHREMGSYVGSITGRAGGDFCGIEVTGTVSGKYSIVGGIAGGAGYGTISATVANVHVIGATAGGLVGWERSSGVVSGSSSTGSIYSEQGSAGGLVSYLSEGSTISQSFSTARVATKKSAGQVGGLVGEINQSQQGYGSVNILNSYALGPVHSHAPGNGPGYGDIGGLVGYEYTGNLTTSYAAGAIHNPDEAGGISGFDNGGANTGNYWDTTTTREKVGLRGSYQGQTGVTGLTDTQLKSGLPSGFDPAIWAQSPTINRGYPYLINNPPS